MWKVYISFQDHSPIQKIFPGGRANGVWEIILADGEGGGVKGPLPSLDPRMEIPTLINAGLFFDN